MLLVAAVVQFGPREGSPAGCDGVRAAYERVSFVEGSGDVPTVAVYRETAAELELSVAEVPADIGAELTRLAAAYGELASLLEGFDPGDESTYHLIEDNAVAVEAQQAVVDGTLPVLRTWLDERCS